MYENLRFKPPTTEAIVCQDGIGPEEGSSTRRLSTCAVSQADWKRRPRYPRFRPVRRDLQRHPETDRRRQHSGGSEEDDLDMFSSKIPKETFRPRRIRRRTDHNDLGDGVRWEYGT